VGAILVAGLAGWGPLFHRADLGPGNERDLCSSEWGLLRSGSVRANTYPERFVGW
jgi:hypothetical protein